MKRLFACGAVMAAFLFPPAGAAASLIPRELDSLERYPESLVRLSGVERDQAERTLRAAGAKEVSGRLGIWRLPSRAARRLVPDLAVAGELTDFEPDLPRRSFAARVSGDPLVSQEWWIARIGADRATPPGPGKEVRVIDSGLDIRHPEFAQRPNTTLLNAQSVTGSREFHGTAVSSVIGAPANGVGVVGVYPEAVLASWDASPNALLTTADVIAGLQAAAARGPGVINLSLGGPDRSRLEEAAVLDAFARGSIVVAAAGNERDEKSPLSYPANYPHVVTVGSTSPTDLVSNFSSATPAMDVAAPGELIPAAIPTSFVPSGFAPVAGTSFSSPLVAGGIAWIWTERADLDKTQMMELVRRSSHDLAPPGRDPDTGFGLLDIPAALALTAPTPDPSEPNDSIDLVRPGGLNGGKAPLTTRARGRASFGARLDRLDDPRDVYRFFVPAGRRVVATERSTGGVDLTALGTRPRTVSLSKAATGGTRTLTFTNRGRRGVELFLNAFVPAAGAVLDVEYTLTIATTRAPR